MQKVTASESPWHHAINFVDALFKNGLEKAFDIFLPAWSEDEISL